MKPIKYLWLIVIVAITGCGTPTGSNFAPARPDPTATVTSENGVAVTPTSVIGDGMAIITYVHPSNRFQIDYPANWHTVARPDGVVFLDPGDGAGYSINFVDVGETYATTALNQYLVTFVGENYGNFPGFRLIVQEQQPDGSVSAQFFSEDPTLGRAINEIRVRQVDTIVFITLVTVTEAQWEISRDRLLGLISTSFQPLDTAPPPTPTAEPPVWTLIGSTDQRFAFLYSDEWDVASQNDTSVVIIPPEDPQIIFEASHRLWSPPRDDAIAEAIAVIENFLLALESQYTNVQRRPVEEFPLDTATGVTVDYLYDTAAGETIAGSMVVVAQGDRVYQVRFQAPAEFYQGALQWFNPMLQSFKILNPDEFIVE